MNVDKMVLAFAGLVVLVSTLLGHYVSAYFLLLTGFVGLNLFQASLTGFCPLAMILKKLGFKSGQAF